MERMPSGGERGTVGRWDVQHNDRLFDTNDGMEDGMFDRRMDGTLDGWTFERVLDVMSCVMVACQTQEDWMERWCTFASLHQVS